MRMLPGLLWEHRAWRAGRTVVAGVDEVGRGAWAGPLVAAAVTLSPDPYQRARLTRALNKAQVQIRDSKMLTPEQRQRVCAIVAELEIASAVVEISVEEIDAHGIGYANQQALRRAALALLPPADHVLVDAFPLRDLGCTQDAIVHGDAISQSIALASIIAKTHRDAIMTALDDALPDYGFAAHKGYGTAVHRAALSRCGVSEHHRRSFAPIACVLGDVAATG